MSVKIAVGLFCAVALSACDSSTLHTAHTACKLAAPYWKLRDIDPPHRVRAWRVRVGTKDFGSGNSMKADDFYQSLEEFRQLRPTPYVIMSSDPSANCKAVISIAQKIDRHFNCEENYCFYFAERKAGR